jgi:hypothetical protein
MNRGGVWRPVDGGSGGRAQGAAIRFYPVVLLELPC